MKSFAQVFQEIDQTNSTNEKVHLMGKFFQNETAHPQREISTYLESTYVTMNQAVNHVGCALNEYLCKKL